MPASILQINTSSGGVPKRAVDTALVNSLGIEGDLHAHPEVHGGPNKALLLITAEGIEELKQQGFPLFYGALGENLTTTGLDRRTLRLGQRWRVGEIVIELTMVRTPCQTIEVYGPRMGAAVYDQSVMAGDDTSPRWGLSGFYASVISGGRIAAGDSIDRLD